MVGRRVPSNGLWMVDLTNIETEDGFKGESILNLACNMVGEERPQITIKGMATATVAEQILYLHACMYSPAPSTMIKAADLGFLSSFPGLTSETSESTCQSRSQQRWETSNNRGRIHSQEDQGRRRPRRRRVITSLRMQKHPSSTKMKNGAKPERKISTTSTPMSLMSERKGQYTPIQQEDSRQHRHGE